MNRSDAGSDDVEVVTAALLSVLLGSDRVESFLVEMARSAIGLVEGALTCGVTVRPLRLAATSDPFAGRMDAIQHEVDDGPCLTALRTGSAVTVRRHRERPSLARVQPAGQARLAVSEDAARHRRPGPVRRARPMLRRACDGARLRR